MAQKNKYSRSFEYEDTQMPQQSSSEALVGFNLQDLENDLRSECGGISPHDVEEELQKTTNFDLDLMAASLWADEERESRGEIQQFAHPSTDKDMKWNLSDNSKRLNLFNQDFEELQLNNHQKFVSQESKYFNSIKSHHLQESQDLNLNHGPYGDLQSPGSAPCTRQYEGGERTHPSLPWSSYDASTQNYTADFSSYNGASSLYVEADLVLDGCATPKDNISNIGFPFSNKNNYVNTNALPCPTMKSSNSSSATYFRMKTPKGYLQLKTVPFGHVSSTVQDRIPATTSSCQGESFPGKHEIHLLAESVSLEGISVTQSPGHIHLGQDQHQCVSQDAPLKKRLPGQHRKPRKFMSPGEEKQQHKRKLASIRSKEQINGEKANIKLLEATEQRELAKKKELGQLCQSFESMRMNCHEVYHQYGTLMPLSFQKELDQYASQAVDRHSRSPKSDNIESNKFPKI
ncbi:uncharacterized protein [Palaemon carinicauda]|uniref:uncharacterized protein n=1 Tax=Palaemon carinicauda TaxID=392227 RepID=UPI0035B616CB